MTAARSKKTPVNPVPETEPEDLAIDALEPEGETEPVPEEPSAQTPPMVEAEEAEAMPHRNHSLKLYRRLAVGFVLLVAAVLGVVLYVSTVKATIHVVPVQETISSEVLLDVVATPTREHEIRGVTLSGELSKTEAAVPSGEGAKEVEGTARGTVTIFNTTDSAQTLVATTRLLAPNDVLFRIDETVNVPAQGSVDVAAHADKPGAAGDIEPTRFTIPGLSQALQAVIYAESKQVFTGGLSIVAAVSQSDIDRAFADVRAALEEDAKAMLRAEAGSDLEGESFTSVVLEQSASVEVGSEASAFDVTMNVRVSGVFFDRSAAQQIATQALYAKLPQGKEFASVNTSGMQATVEKTDEESGTANVRVSIDGFATVSLTSSLLQPSRFVGMKEDDVRQTLKMEGIAQDVTVEFFPGWIRKIPRLKDHIYVVIE